MDLSFEDRRCLEAAQGWLDLGGARKDAEAENELASISIAGRAHPDVLTWRFNFCANYKRWEEALKIARGFCKSSPGNPDAWVYLAEALDKMKKTNEARDILLSVVANFPEDWQIPIQLAHCVAKLGAMDDARHWLEAAILRNKPMVKKFVLDDRSLEAFWAVDRQL